ncbi:DHA2 family efflux MFS transporter permease subunit [Actinomadura parmotrematis]|uniref:DHA2 family efflux MFS transporter permease subunit n=1 Tax=Actinomadura parmotrematis TaxID=2864039 RepID=A0ABS7G4R0_9ACTN|nr:DHA2 family efflux MFS transporter permease subunit [Actinomadura parmotrematis]MBW8487715.1 DHA2 family efflux MFS transporter permease subunit [Actinomadura parmotrematis]
MKDETSAATAPDTHTPMDGPGPTPAVQEAAGGRSGLLALGSTLALGAVLALLSTTIVTVGTGELSEEFSSPLSTVQWVGTGYLLALAVAIPVAGWAMERWGSKTLWQAALAVYIAGCAVAALAPTVGVLIGARVVQGLGAAMFEPIMLTLLATAAGPKRATAVMSLVQIPITLAPVFGPMAGGLLLDHLSWQWLFWCNVPLGLLCAVMAHLVLPADPPRSQRTGSRLDVLGLALLPPGLAALLLGSSQIAAGGGFGSAAVWAPLLIGAVMVAGYVVHALRTAGVPLIDVRLFTTGRFGAAVAGAFLFGASVYGTMFLLPLFFQRAGGYSAWDSGLLLAPQGIGTVMILPMVGRLTARFGPRTVVLAGMAVSVLGTLAYTQADAGQGTGLLVVSLLVRGAGLGTTLAPALAAGFGAVAPRHTGRAAAALIASVQLGGSAGTALLAVVVQQQITDRLGEGGGRASAAVSPDLAAPLTAAFGAAFWWTLGICVLGAVAALFLPGAQRGTQA